MKPPGEDSDTDQCVLHGRKASGTANGPVFRPYRLVAFLHAVRVEKRRPAGIALVEVIVAIALLGTGVLGVVGIGHGAHRMVGIAAARTAQAVTAVSVMEGDLVNGTRMDDVIVDTTRIGMRLVELKVTVRGRGGARDWSSVTRRLAGPQGGGRE